MLSLVPLAPIAVRLVYLQILQHKDLSALASHSTDRKIVEIIPRGRILDRNDYVLAQTLPAWSAFLDHKVFLTSSKPEYELRRVGGILGMTKDHLRSLLKTETRTIWLKRGIPVEEAQALKDLKLELKMASIGITMEQERFYPNDGMLRPLLGAVNDLGIGSAGLEQSLQTKLIGQKVQWTAIRDGKGRAIQNDGRPDHIPPPDIRLTVNRTLQYFAETALEETVRAHQAKKGSVLVQDPRNGDILVMASYPSTPLLNPAIQDVYEPGSTFKIIMAAAAIESGVLTEGEKIFCESGKWQMTPNVRIKDHEPLGPLSLEEIIRYSSNIGSAKIGLRLGAERFHHYAHLFGFGYKTGIPLPGESKGLMKPAHNINRVRLANAAFGQGLAVTPLQLIGAYSAVANGGVLYEPRIILAYGAEEARAPVIVRRVIPAETARRLQTMLESVVESGTGMSAQVPGYRIAGKTGTAQKVDPATKQYSETDFIASFAGYVPARDPRFTILVSIDSPQKGGHYGSLVAAPLFRKLVQRILTLQGIAPELPLPLRLNGERPPVPVRPLPPHYPPVLKGAAIGSDRSRSET